MSSNRPRKPRPPLDQARLDELALSYVGRFATTKSKLDSYLKRKLRERGWGGQGAADVAALVARFARSGLVDDSAYALAKSESLARRGYGKRRLTLALRVAGVDGEAGADALDHADQAAVSAALRFAQRRRFGPYAPSVQSDLLGQRKQRERHLSAMVRAGHGFALSAAILALPAGVDPDEEALAADFCHTNR